MTDLPRLDTAAFADARPFHLPDLVGDTVAAVYERDAGDHDAFLVLESGRVVMLEGDAGYHADGVRRDWRRHSLAAWDVTDVEAGAIVRRHHAETAEDHAPCQKGGPDA